MSPYPAWPFLSDPAHPFLSALWAVLARGMVALFAVAPLVRRSRHPLAYAALAFAGGSLIDLDHFVAAGSLSLHRIETLGDRPDTHSLAFVSLLALLALALTRRPRVAWAVFAVNASHLLYDAAGGHEPVLYPFSHLDGLPWILCPLGTLALFAASLAIAPRPARAAPARAAEERPRTVLDAG
jgi:membrane-bound metal-dependent hydrolase YbcI (DUF457 family)